MDHAVQHLLRVLSVGCPFIHQRVVMASVRTAGAPVNWPNCRQLYIAFAQELDVDAPSVSMAARRVMYTWPQLLELFPPALVTAAYATVASGRAARQWLDNRQ